MIPGNAARNASRVPVAEVERYFGAYVERVAVEGERFVLTRDGKPVAELAPVLAERQHGSLDDIFSVHPKMSPEEAESFARDVEAARAEMNIVPRIHLQDPDRCGDLEASG